MYIAIGNMITSSSQMNGAAASGGGGFENVYSMAFDGVDDFINCGAATYLDGLTTATISLWVQPLTTGITDVIRRGNTSSSDIRIWIYPSSDRIDFGIGSSICRTTTTTLNVGTWYHIYACYDKDLNNGKDMILFVDGVEQAATNTNATIATGTEDLIIGENYYNSNCKVDEVALWTTDQRAEVSTVYNSGVPNNLDDLTTPPTAWYRMGENGVYKSPQWLLPENSNKDKVSNYSFEFDGINDQISLPDIPFLRAGGQNFSISAWVYHTAIGQGGYFGSRIAPSSTNTINFYRNTNGSAVLLINNSSTGNIELRSSNSSITTNNWHHVVATFDGTQTDAADRLNIYVDGVLDNGYQSGTGTNLPSGSTGIYNFLGRVFLGVRQTGKIDNLAIWDSTLTAGNVTTLYNSGSPVDISTLSPTAGWKLGEDATFSTDWTIPDSIGSFDGTSANMTIEDRVGEAPNSTSNSLSYNMDEADRETDVPS